jgi:hypothetical protein
MRVFHCNHCDKLVFFENTECEHCGHRLAYVPQLRAVVSLDPTGKSTPRGPTYTTPMVQSEGQAYRLCANYTTNKVCNWAMPFEDHYGLCMSCRMTEVIPNINLEENQLAWQKIEAAKHRLIFSLLEFGLPLRSRVEDPVRGLAFELLADQDGAPPVMTGHDEGVITLAIAEADDVERERRRHTLHEPYRTLLGHFRHEVGHYYWDQLIADSPRLEACREVFGDERLDYDAALKIHYKEGPPKDWNSRFISTYASTHPWEDWAETWAHYLHMTDTLETAAACGLSLHPIPPNEPVMERQPVKPAHQQEFAEIIKNWIPLTYALNILNRGMGLGDAYPFVLPPPAIEKLRFIHETISDFR